MAKPSLPQGTRDFGPAVVRKRNFIFNTIRTVFELYGFQPLETPAIEQIDTLMGKYGEEGDKLLFKILNNGLDHPDKATQVRADFEKVLQGKTTKGITERALKYDLTIPFARYVAMNHGQLTFPFKRYQVQPVWRADRPQRGRYREFYQCDADIVGSTALLNEVELVHLYATVFSRLKLNVTIRINSRKLLQALAEIAGGVDKMAAITIAIDKLDKIGMEKVKEELAQRQLDAEQIQRIEHYLQIRQAASDNNAVLSSLGSLLNDSAAGKSGLDDLHYVVSKCAALPAGISLDIDPTLARGLNYYTGCIFEVVANDVKIGSIGGGGRYDDLTGLFGVPGIPGVGISFGVDRIYDVMEELALFPDDVHTGTRVLFFHLGTAEADRAFTLMQDLRAKGISAELYHETAKFDKQFKYAEKKKIPFIVIIGDKELAEKTVTIKDLESGQQQTIPVADLLHFTF